MSHLPWNSAWEKGNEEFDRQQTDLLDRLKGLLVSLLNGWEQSEGWETLPNLGALQN